MTSRASGPLYWDGRPLPEDLEKEIQENRKLNAKKSNDVHAGHEDEVYVRDRIPPDWDSDGPDKGIVLSKRSPDFRAYVNEEWEQESEALLNPPEWSPVD